MRGQELLQERCLVGLVLGRQATGEYPLTPVQLELTRRGQGRQLGLLLLKRDLLPGEGRVRGGGSCQSAVEVADLGLQLVDGHGHVREVGLRRSDLAGQARLLLGQLRQLRLLGRDQLGQPLLLGDSIRERIRR